LDEWRVDEFVENGEDADEPELKFETLEGLPDGAKIQKPCLLL
jgi:hypothetical protein